MNFTSKIISFLTLSILISATFLHPAHADWPLWKGGQIKNVFWQKKDGTKLSRNDCILKLCQGFEVIEVYNLSHLKKDWDWKITFPNGGYQFKVYWKTSISKTWSPTSSLIIFSYILFFHST